MTDAKVKNQELIKLRRDVALRELALASSYPQTHTGIVMQRKRIDGAIPVTPEARLQASALPATAVATPVDPRQRRARDNPDPPANAAKPWKKPWDK